VVAPAELLYPLQSPSTVLNFLFSFSLPIESSHLSTGWR
jgi:hypothetical protein